MIVFYLYFYLFRRIDYLFDVLEFLANLSGCHESIPSASPFSILAIISLNMGLPGSLAVMDSVKTSKI